MAGDLVRTLREEAQRLSGLSMDRGVQEAGISANLADRAADVIEEYAAKEVLADRAHKAMTAEIEKLQRNMRHWREECGKLHAQNKIAGEGLNDLLEAHQMELRVLYEALERALSHFAVMGTKQAVMAAQEIEAVLRGSQGVTRCTECPERMRP